MPSTPEECKIYKEMAKWEDGKCVKVDIKPLIKDINECTANNGSFNFQTNQCISPVVADEVESEDTDEVESEDTDEVESEGFSNGNMNNIVFILVVLFLFWLYQNRIQVMKRLKL